MLLSDDKRFAIPTATKTGTFSLESVLTRHGYGQIMPRHRDRIPDDWHGAQVVFLCRDPYARLVSMYRYGIVKKHSWLLKAAGGADAVATLPVHETFDTFCRNWAAAFDERKPHDWTMLCHDYVRAAEQTNSVVNVIRLEDDGIHGLLSYVGLGHLQDKNINQSSNRFSKTWDTLWNSRNLKVIGDRVVPDLRLGRYEKPNVGRAG